MKGLKMKYYIYDGKRWDKIPDPFQGCSPMRFPDGSPNDELFVKLGGTIEEDDEPTHMELMDAACDTFVAVSNDIGDFIGDPDFQGGIDEIDKLYQSEAAQQNPEQALILAARWLAADKALNHWASKDDVNLASPACWWYCWERYANQQEAAESESENNSEE